MRRLSLILASIALSGVMMTTPAFAQTGTAPTLSADAQRDLETTSHYMLPADFFTRAADAIRALAAARVTPPDSTHLSLQQTIQQIGATPGVPEILAAHGFTPESFTLGLTTFGMTLAATNGQTLPQGFPAPNPANITLFHTHPDQVTALMQAMGTPPGQQN